MHIRPLHAYFPALSSVSLISLLGVVFADGIILAFSDLGVAESPKARAVACLILGTCAVMAFLSVIYTRFRPVKGIALMASACLSLIVFTLAASFFNYFTTTFNLPAQDRVFAAMDRALGLDWVVWLQWMNEHFVLGRLLGFTYKTTSFEIALVVIVLGLIERYEDLRGFVDLICLTCLLTIAISCLFPSAGAYAFYAPSPGLFQNLDPTGGCEHIACFVGLRDGDIRSFDISRVKGLISFPSFHTTVAVLVVWSFRNIPYAFVFAFAWNTLIIASTPVNGGHYFVDTLAGAALALAAIALRKLRMDFRHLN